MIETKVLLTGSSGFIGKRLIELLELPLQTPDSTEFNILNQDSITNYLKTHQPTSIVNLAAYTDVKAAESQRDNKSTPAWKINVNGVQNLVDISQSLNIHFIQISTDCVFPGNNQYPGPFAENDQTIDNPNLMSWYAYTKLKAEEIVKQYQNSAIVRIAFPFGSQNPNKDYVLKLIKTIELGYPLFRDQKFSPTYINDLALVLEKIIQEHLTGNFHAVSADITNPLDIGTYLSKKIRLGMPVKPGWIKAVNTSVINQYPELGGLRSEYTQTRLGIMFHTAKEALDEFLPTIK